MDTSGNLWIRQGNLVIEDDGNDNAFSLYVYSQNDGSADFNIDAGDGDKQYAPMSEIKFGLGANAPDGTKDYLFTAVLNVDKYNNNGLMTAKLYMGQAGDKTDDEVYRVQESHAAARGEHQLIMVCKLRPLSNDLASITIASDTNSGTLFAGNVAGRFSSYHIQRIT